MVWDLGGETERKRNVANQILTQAPCVRWQLPLETQESNDYLDKLEKVAHVVSFVILTASFNSRSTILEKFISCERKVVK